MNLFKKKVIKNNAANLKVLENRIKVLSDSLEAESESVDIYKNEYDKLLKKYEELIYKHNYTISSLKLLKAIINQNSNYTDEQLVFNSVQKYSKYLETMINIVIDYSCTEKENKSDSFEEKYLTERNEHELYVDKMKWIKDSLKNTALRMQSGFSIDYEQLETYVEALDEFLSREDIKKEGENNECN